MYMFTVKLEYFYQTGIPGLDTGVLLENYALLVNLYKTSHDRSSVFFISSLERACTFFI